ncbi:haloacid dehalogenase-like hydrolase [Aspergillus eucalypticola CBS 122712]|uniref:Haloacid dehalogenase-like hydrolase n=1 Tax=Aspergillus eucalypticola (strain CBS 122712 / IBT 29274) TaxID=1448314 RepID=A0A317W0H0_ASPEC|nr:haloacid dehalogenase-like hydrolase [Aspergillus eucalypticola CBS 122712]PWY80146.1 haloacid dehalogenase-like hydrolase [Aspergillus eucalypticola CBS 122712]
MRLRTLLLTIDAFNTIFQPRHPIAEQYISAFNSFKLQPSPELTPSILQPAFKSAYKAQSRHRPNYGRADAIRGQYGGPRQWWEELIRTTFQQVSADKSTKLPDELIQGLLDRFASSQGYALYNDAGELFQRLRQFKTTGQKLGVFERIVVGVLSNSDDRVPAVLQSLGLSVGKGRADQEIESLKLPGFEDPSSITTDEYGEKVDDIDLVITSYQAGEEKPSPVIFDVAERQARRLVGAGEEDGDWVRVHVGDDYDKDYRAAVDAGWKGVYVLRDEGGGREGVVIRSLVDLIPILEGMK